MWRSNHNQIHYKQCLVALGSAIRKVQKNMEGVKLNETQWLLACANDLPYWVKKKVQNAIVITQEDG